MKEGVIKFASGWERKAIHVDPSRLSLLNRWRSRMRDVGLIGVLPDGTGFGNISIRVEAPIPNQPPGVLERKVPAKETHSPFLITGSGTGGVSVLGPGDLSLVLHFDLVGNRLHCQGLTQASSESLSHGAIYAARPEVGAVIHIHSATLWKALRGRVPTTPPDAEYGTPELALALQGLCRGLAPGGPTTLVMGGHSDGLMVVGDTLERTGRKAMGLLEDHRGRQP